MHVSASGNYSYQAQRSLETWQNTGIELPKFGIDITGFYVNVKLLICSMICHQDSCTNQDNLQQQNAAYLVKQDTWSWGRSNCISQNFKV